MTHFHLAPKWAQNEQQTYTVPMICTNCNHHGNVQFPKGTRVGRSMFDKPYCPECGCRTLVQSV